MISNEAVCQEASQIVRIFIVNNQKLLRQGLRLLLETKPSMQVVGEAAADEAGLSEAIRQQADIFLLDLGDPHRSQLEFLHRLTSSATGRVIVLTGFTDTETHRQAVRYGALGIVQKDEDAAVLFRAIERVQAGEAWLNHRMTANVIADISRRHKPDLDQVRIASLTDREREIITVVCEGLKNQQIAERLFISEATVRNHLTSILGKLGLGDRFELAIFSYRHRLAQPPLPESA